MDSETKVTPLIELIAKNFSWRLWTNLPRIEYFEAVRRNEVETDPRICHMHDFCDANVYMQEAFEYVTGEELDVTSDRHVDLINAAWDHAKASWKRKQPEWVTVLTELLNCPDLGLEELEPATLRAMSKATSLLNRWQNGEFENE